MVNVNKERLVFVILIVIWWVYDKSVDLWM